MDNAQANNAKVLYVEESAWGTTPASALTYLRMTGESLQESQSNTESEEITGNRGVADILPVSKEASGDINFELLSGAYDDLLEGALAGAWATAVSITESDISAAASDNSINTAAGDFTSSGPSVGQWVKVAGFSTNPATLYGRVVSVTSAKIVLSGVTLVDESAGASITVSGQMLRSGTTLKSYTIEKQLTDVTKFLIYRGMIVNSLNLDIASDAVITGSLAFLGKGEELASATSGTGGPTAAPTTNPMTAGSNVAKIVEGGGDIGSNYATNLTVALNNNARTQAALGTTERVGAVLGKAQVTGNLTMYFLDGTYYTKLKNNTESSICAVLTDSAGNAIIVTLPRVKYVGGKIVAGSADTDCMAELEYQGIQDSTTGCSIQLDKFSA